MVGLIVAAAVSAVLGVPGVLWLRSHLVVVDIHGPSMEPTFAPGDRVLVRRRRMERLRVGDVVVFEAPDTPGEWFRPAPGGDETSGRQWVIKRVAALPGEPIPEGLAAAPPLSAAGAGDAAAAVPPGFLLVLGDNTGRSVDSRVWGFIPAARLLGVMQRRMVTRGAAAGS